MNFSLRNLFSNMKDITTNVPRSTYWSTSPLFHRDQCNYLLTPTLPTSNFIRAFVITAKDSNASCKTMSHTDDITTHGIEAYMTNIYSHYN